MVKLVTHRRANGLLVQRSRAPHCLCGNVGSIPAQTVEVDFVSKVGGGRLHSDIKQRKLRARNCKRVSLIKHLVPHLIR